MANSCKFNEGEEVLTYWTDLDGEIFKEHSKLTSNQLAYFFFFSFFFAFSGGSTTVQTLNGSHSEDSVAETALSKKNSDGE